MIKVNLLPQELLGKGTAGAPSPTTEGSGVVIIMAVLLFGFAAVVFGWTKHVENTSLAARQTVEAARDAEKKQLAEKKTEWSAIEEQLQIMQNQKAVIDALDPPDRLLWTKKVNMLPALVPTNLFISEIVVKQTVEETETQESITRFNTWVAGGSKGTPPVKEKRPIINQTLAMTCLAYSPDSKSEEWIGLAREFMSNLSNKKIRLPYTNEEEIFMAGFQGEFKTSALERTTIGDREVAKFTLTLKAKPVAIETKKPGADKAAAKKPTPTPAAKR